MESAFSIIIIEYISTGGGVTSGFLINDNAAENDKLAGQLADCRRDTYTFCVQGDRMLCFEIESFWLPNNKGWTVS